MRTVVVPVALVLLALAGQPSSAQTAGRVARVRAETSTYDRLQRMDREAQAAGAARDLPRLVALDREIRDIVATRWVNGVGVLPGWYRRLGLEPFMFDADYAGYSGRLLRDAHRIDPESEVRASTLFSTIYPKGEGRADLVPDLAAARRYLDEFPEGPFAADVHRVLGDFYDDLFKVLREGDRLVDDKRACYQRFVTRRPVAEQMRAAQRSGVAHYRAALALRPSDGAAREFRQTLSAGMSTGWHHCAD